MSANPISSLSARDNGLTSSVKVSVSIPLGIRYTDFAPIVRAVSAISSLTAITAAAPRMANDSKAFTAVTTNLGAKDALAAPHKSGKYYT